MTGAEYDPKPPTRAELPALLQDVRYEHTMFAIAGFYVTQVDAAENATSDDLRKQALRTAHNAWVESFNVHLRNLTDFYISRPRLDDVVAHHYATGWTRASGGEDLEWIDDISTSLNKRLAHLTAYRQRVPKSVDVQFVEDIRQHVAAVWWRWWAMLDAATQAGFIGNLGMSGPQYRAFLVAGLGDGEHHA